MTDLISIFWQTAEIKNLHNKYFYCRLNASNIKHPKILKAINSTLCYERNNNYIAPDKESFDLLLNRIRESEI